MEASTRAHGFLLIAAVAVLATVAFSQVPEPGARSEVDEVLVGDLKLADEDEGPSDGVRGTFTARELAPGDRYASALVVVREAETSIPSAVEPRVSVEIDVEGDRLLAEHLLVRGLDYGDHELVRDAERVCGSPLTLALLAECTRGEENPLAALEDPTPEGTPLRLMVELSTEAGNDQQGQAVGFDVTVELYGEKLAMDPPEPCPTGLGARTSPPRDLARADPLVSGRGTGGGLVGPLLAAQLPSSC